MKKNHLFSIITAGMLTITLLAGCGNTGSNANADTGSNTNTVQESTEDQASAVPESEAQITGEGQNGETIIVTDVRGEVEIPADPQRIVDLSGNLVFHLVFPSLTGSSKARRASQRSR